MAMTGRRIPGDRRDDMQMPYSMSIRHSFNIRSW
jgi:hypothetical protein